MIIDALKNVGCDTAKSVLSLPVEEIAARADRSWNRHRRSSKS